MQKLGFIDKTMVLLQKVLDLRTQNQQTIASNVANAHTPGYIPARLKFEERLKQAVNTPIKDLPQSNPHHFAISTARIEAVEPEIIRRRENPLRTGDGNEVDINQEMMFLAENQLLYETASQILKKKFGMIKYVTEQGGK